MHGKLVHSNDPLMTISNRIERRVRNLKYKDVKDVVLMQGVPGCGKTYSII